MKRGKANHYNEKDQTKLMSFIDLTTFPAFRVEICLNVGVWLNSIVMEMSSAVMIRLNHFFE